MSPILRPYQIDVTAEFERHVERGDRSILLVASTGSGKTVIAAAIIAETARRVLVVAHRREIVNQTADKLTARGVLHGIIQAGDEEKLRPMAAVQVASIQTLHVRAIRSATMLMPLADLLVIDEAHHACTMTYQKVIETYPDAIVLGLTATPCRGDGRGLGGIFKTMIECPQVPDLIEQGYLVRSRVYAPVDPDLRGVRTQAGDYVESQLAERMDRDQLVGDIVTHWFKYGESRKTVAFACSVGHSIHIRDEFIKAGVRAEHLDGGTPKDEREAILARLASGDTEVVTNCMVLTEGFDCPDICCIILARPTKKMGPLSPDDRPRVAAGRRQERCRHPRSLRRRFPARPAGGPRGVDARPRSASHCARAYQASGSLREQADRVLAVQHAARWWQAVSQLRVPA
jgi:superfamily II DNA or RNA helicase